MLFLSLKHVIIEKSRSDILKIGIDIDNTLTEVQEKLNEAAYTRSEERRVGKECSPTG